MADQGKTPGRLAGRAEGSLLGDEAPNYTEILGNATARSPTPTPPSFPILLRHWPRFPLDAAARP